MDRKTLEFEIWNLQKIKSIKIQYKEHNTQETIDNKKYDKIKPTLTGNSLVITCNDKTKKEQVKFLISLESIKTIIIREDQ